ncbi:MAG: MBL fold metallo-hydrolase [Chloroflexota bacterium]|jgi:ribonuclease BN (tRNA processing enzyme)|nr:MBL fold metallo-hydrolase [Chloroflexota bacterium]
MGEVSVQFLGSGDAFGSGGRFQTCIYVRSEAAHLLVDCGASSLIAMKRFGVDPLLIDTILLSHLHGDHFGGVPFFIMEAHYVLRRRKPLLVAGPPGLEARIFEAMEVLFPGSSQMHGEFALKFVELPEETATTIGSLLVTPYNVVHPSGAPSYALRIALGDKILAYSGDTEWTDALIPATRGADLFVCECSSLEKGSGYHLDYLTLMNHRAELECRKLILTHMNDDMLHRLGSLNFEGANDGKVVVL